MTPLPKALALLALLAAALPDNASAQNTVTWDGTCLTHPRTPSNLWNARCMFPPDLDDFTNWDTELFPGRTDHVVIPAGVPGGVRIFDSFSSFSATINAASPILIDGGGPVFMLDPAGVSNMVDLTLANGQITVAHQLVLSGDSSMAEGVFTDDFGDADGGHLILTDNFTVTGLEPDPFARTGLFIKRVENRGTVDFSGPVSADVDSVVDNHGTWTFTDASTYGTNTADFINHPDAVLGVDVDTPGGTVFLASKLNNDHGTFNHTRGTLVLTAAGNQIDHGNRGAWTMGPGTTIALDSGFPGFGIPAATLDWQGDTLAGPTGGGATLEVRENATLELPNGTDRTLNGVSLVNHGTVEHGTDDNRSSDEDLCLTAGATFTNGPTGTYELGGEFGRGRLVIGGAGSNAGTVRLNGTIAITGDSPFENTGTVEVRDLRRATVTGTSQLDSTFLNNGTLRDGPDTQEINVSNITLRNSGTIDFATPVDLSRATLRQTDGTWTAGGSIRSPSFDDDARIEVRGGQFNVDSSFNFQLQPRFDLSGGDVNLTAPAVILSGGGSSTGSATVTLHEDTNGYFTGEPHHFDGDYQVTGDGELQFGMTHEQRLRLRPDRRGPGNVSVDGGTLTIDITGGSAGQLVNRSTLTIADDATVAVQSPPVVANAGTIDLHGDITMPAGSRILNGDPDNPRSSSARLRIASNPGETNQLPHTVDNPRGEIIATAGSTAVLSGDVLQADTGAGTLSGGTWVVEDGASLDLRNLTLTSLTAPGSIELEGSGQFLPLARSTSFVNDGSVDLDAGADLTHGGFWENNGFLSIESGCALTVTGQFETNEGSNIRLDGSLTVADFDNDGGRFAGSGTINASSFNNDGELSPGSSPGTLTINGNFSQSATGTLNIEIAGPARGTDHDQLVVSGAATLGGNLTVCLAPGFHPAPGQTFEVVDAGSLAGTFDRIDTGATGGRTTFTAAYADGKVTLTAAAATYPDYATWRAAKFDPIDAADPLVSGPDADPDGDRIPNALEYAAALRPTKPDHPPFTYRTEPATPRTVDALVPYAVDTTGVTPTFQASTDLTAWAPVAATLAETLTPAPPALPVRVYRITLPPGDHGYVRLSGAE